MLFLFWPPSVSIGGVNFAGSTWNRVERSSANGSAMQGEANKKESVNS